MARRRQKRRTHVKEAELDTSIPRSMVIKMGDAKREPTKALSTLVKDFRTILQPHTAARLRERKANRLKDYLVMAGPLGVSHFFLFSQSHTGNTTLRIARTPRGPTLYFRVEQYSLARDIQKYQARPHSLTHELRAPPVLVMNNFSSDKTSDKDALLTSVFQNMLPTINIQTTRLSDVQRVLLLEKDPETGDIELRHYAVITRTAGTSRAVKKLAAAQRGQRELPNLSQMQDVSEYMEDPGLSESEGEDEVIGEGTPAAAEAPQKIKRAVKLVEVGPRLRLKLLKIEDGLCQGKTLFHAIEKRTEKQAAALERKHKQRDSLRAERRKQQEANVLRKREEAAAKSSRSARGKRKAQELDDANGDDSGDGEEAGDGGNGGNNADQSDQSDSDMADAPDPSTMNDYELEAELAAASGSDSE